MGAQQSSTHDSNASPNGPAKTCYYDVLGVERQACEDEIKKAYRRKALELHPDRNYGNVEEATANFAEVSAAYEILSDPQERAWYDSHRDSILRGDGSGPEDGHFEHNIRVTGASTLVALMARFNSRTPMTDAPNGFYGILSQTFASLAKEEDVACDWEGLEAVDYPEFGHSADGYEDGVKAFYRVWLSFSTRKTFSWRDQYRTSEAPDRQMRRLMEKENKRLRDEGIREFNDAVRSLVAFVRKRDPRFTPNTQSEADRQKVIRDAAAAQAARSRAANKAKLDSHVVPKWAQAQKPQAEEGGFSSEEEEVIQCIECVVCDKIFKSEKQYEAHEKSKKHTKAVQRLQRHMRQEDENLELDADNSTTKSEDLPFEEPGGVKSSTTPPPERSDDLHLPFVARDHGTKKEAIITANSKTEPASIETPTSDFSGTDGEYASKKEVEARLDDAVLGALDSSTTSLLTENVRTTAKLGAAKVKRAKKLSQQQQATQDDQAHKCAVCNEGFPSKTKLFHHIDEEGHAARPPKRGKAKRSKKK